MLPKPLRAMFYWVLRSGPLGRFVTDIAAWGFYFWVKIFRVKPRQDLAGLTVISHRHKFIYFGIPKVASRSFYNLFVIDKRDEWDIEWHEKRGAFFDAIEAYPDYYTFSFVRNPWSRIVSCWKSKVEDNIIGKRARVLSFYRGLRGGMAFGDFVHWLGTEEGSDAAADRHWVSQHLLLSGGRGEVLCDFVGRYENLSADWVTVCAHVGIDAAALPQKGYVSAAGETFNPEDAADASVDVKISGYKDLFDDEMRGVIERRYAKDIEVFGYEF